MRVEDFAANFGKDRAYRIEALRASIPHLLIFYWRNIVSDNHGLYEPT